MGRAHRLVTCPAVTIYGATPTRLSGGDWGVRIDGCLKVGTNAECRITAKSGKTWNGTYTVVWNDGTFRSLGVRDDSSTGNSHRPTQQSERGRSHRCPECGNVRPPSERGSSCAYPC